MATTPQRPDPRISARLPDPIADLRVMGKFLRVLEQMRVLQEQNKRNE